MTFAPIPPPPAPPSPPEEKRPRRFSRTQRVVIAGGLAAGLALGGAGISFAASSESSSSTTTPPSTNTPTAPVKPGHGPRGLGKGLFGFGALGRAVHGQATVRTGSGYQTITFQVGKAGPVSSSSITVTSADNWQHTYTVTPSTVVDAQAGGINSVKAGDQVRVTAKSASGSDTALNIVDVTRLQQSRSGFGFGPAGKPAHSARAAVAGAF